MIEEASEDVSDSGTESPRWRESAMATTGKHRAFQAGEQMS